MSDRDPIRDCLSAPGDPDEESFWEMSLIALTRAGNGPTWEFSVPEGEKSRLKGEMLSGQTSYFTQLSFTDVYGVEHEWFDVKIVAFARSTIETRNAKRRWEANSELHMEKIAKQQRRDAGMEFGE